MRLVALVDVDASFGNVGWKESPAFVTNAESFVSLRFAVSVRAALNIFARSLAWKSWRCSDESGVALAFVRAGDVQARRTIATNVWVTAALVDIHAHRAGRVESFLTEALTFDTFRIVGTVEIAVAENVDVSLFARNFRIGLRSVALGTDAVVARRCVLADGIISARPLQRGALINVHASLERISSEISFARANVASGCVGADCVMSTRAFETLVDICLKH